VRGCRINGRQVTVSLGRQVLGLPPYGTPKVWHDDGDPLNCRKANLRVARSYLLRHAVTPDLERYLSERIIEDARQKAAA
jgi:hypothetical protein